MSEIRLAKDVMCALAQTLVLERSYPLLRDLPNRTRLGIHFNVEVRCDNHGYEKDGNTHHEEWERRYWSVLHFIVAQPHRVYCAVTQQQNWRKVLPEEYRNTSNHDSCWRSDGFSLLEEEWYKAYNACWDHMPKEHTQIPLTANISVSLVPLFSMLHQLVLIERAPIEDEKKSNSGYFDQIKSIKPIKMSVNLDLTVTEDIES